MAVFACGEEKANMIFCVYGDAILPGDDTGFGWGGPPIDGGQAHTVEVTASTLYEAVALPWRAGAGVGGDTRAGMGGGGGAVRRVGEGVGDGCAGGA